MSFSTEPGVPRIESYEVTRVELFLVAGTDSFSVLGRVSDATRIGPYIESCMWFKYLLLLVLIIIDESEHIINARMEKKRLQPKRHGLSLICEAIQFTPFHSPQHLRLKRRIKCQPFAGLLQSPCS